MLGWYMVGQIPRLNRSSFFSYYTVTVHTLYTLNLYITLAVHHRHMLNTKLMLLNCE